MGKLNILHETFLTWRERSAGKRMGHMARAEEAKRKNRVERERLFSNLGGFFSSFPADSEGWISHQPSLRGAAGAIAQLFAPLTPPTKARPVKAAHIQATCTLIQGSAQPPLSPPPAVSSGRPHLQLFPTSTSHQFNETLRNRDAAASRPGNRCSFLNHQSHFIFQSLHSHLPEN